MYDDNDFNVQRRNLIIINCIICVILISNINIESFKILSIIFEITPDNSILTNYNVLFELAWLYLNIRYISTLLDKIISEKRIFKHNNKVNQLVTNEVNTAKELLNGKSLGIKLFAIWFVLLFTFLKSIFKIITPLFEKAIFDYIIPLLFSSLLLLIYYNNIVNVIILWVIVFFIGMSIDAKKLNVKHERYIDRKRKNK